MSRYRSSNIMAGSSAMIPYPVAPPQYLRRTPANLDKKLVNVQLVGITNTQSTTVLSIATFPCTIIGLRWEGAYLLLEDGGFTQFAWAIIVLREGIAPNNLSLGNGTTLYEPEQDVLVYGRSLLHIDAAAAEHTTYPLSGSTKTMRKLQGGDQLVFIVRADNSTYTFNISMAVQFFCKT